MSDQDISEIKHDYYLGNYQSCIGRASAFSDNREAIYYLCLSHIYLKKFDKLSKELSRWNDPVKEYLSLYSDFIRGSNDRTSTAEILDDLTKESDVKDELSMLIICALYAQLREHLKALQVIDHLDSLVATYHKILILIQMNRADLADKQLSTMTKKDEYAVMTELAQAQVLLANKNPTHAWRIAGSLADRFRPTPFLFNIQTAAAICLGEYDSAKELCENALDMDNDNLEALINIVHIQSKLRSSLANLTRNIDRLVEMYPDNEIVKDCEQIKLIGC